MSRFARTRRISRPAFQLQEELVLSPHVIPSPLWRTGALALLLALAVCAVSAASASASALNYCGVPPNPMFYNPGAECNGPRHTLTQNTVQNYYGT